MGKVLYKITFGEFAGAIGTIAAINPTTNMVLFYPLTFSMKNPYVNRFFIHTKQLGRLDAEVYYD